MCVLLEAGLAVTPHTLVQQLGQVCLKRGWYVLERGKCECLVLDLEEACVCEG